MVSTVNINHENYYPFETAIIKVFFKEN